MVDAEARRACVVVMEVGAEWPDWLLDGACGEVVARVTQEDGETPAELALRVGERIRELDGTQLEALVIAVGSESGDEVFSSRCEMARALLREVHDRHGIRLLFSAPRQLGSEARRELLSLTSTLASQLAGVRVIVGAHLGARRPATQPAPAAH